MLLSISTTPVYMSTFVFIGTSTNARALQRAKNIVKPAPYDSTGHILYPVLINIGNKLIMLSLFGVIFLEFCALKKSVNIFKSMKVWKARKIHSLS